MKRATARAPQFRGAPVDVVVDVRSKLEFWTGHLPGAVCIPVDRIPEGIADKNISKASRILVYCAGGVRSAAAAAQLRAAGYTNVVDGGGISDARSDFAPGG